jgi:hypothetical protein
MITTVVILVIWNLLLTGCLVGAFFRLQDITRLLDALHVRVLQLALREKE